MKKTMFVLFLSGLFFSQLGFAEESAIIEAARPGNAEKIKALSLHWAAHFDDAENIRWLLERGARLDSLQVQKLNILILSKTMTGMSRKSFLEGAAQKSGRNVS